MWWERFWGARGEGAGSKGEGAGSKGEGAGSKGEGAGSKGVTMGARRREQNPIEYDFFLNNLLKK